MIRKMKQTRRSTRPRRDGAAIVEMALVLPIVFTFLFGTIDFAQVMYAYGMVSEASRAGARYAMVNGKNSTAPAGPAANDAALEAYVKKNSPALDQSKMTITSTWSAGTNDATSPVTVTVSYQCTLSAGQLIGIANPKVSATSTMRITH